MGTAAAGPSKLMREASSQAAAGAECRLERVLGDGFGREVGWAVSKVTVRGKGSQTARTAGLLLSLLMLDLCSWLTTGEPIERTGSPSSLASRWEMVVSLAQGPYAQTRNKQ